MASSSPFKRCISLSHNSPNACKNNISNHSESVDAKMTKYRLSKSHSLLRKPLQRQEIEQKPFGRRRFTFSGQDHKVFCKKRRRFTSIALPTKFLLGGNITDPLNLRSLEDEKINQQLNAFTPESSPMPMSRHRTQVQVLIPPNIYDPLNLNTGEDIEFNLFSGKPRKRRRHRKSRREEHERLIDASLRPVSQLVAPSVIKSIPSTPVEEHVKEVKPIQISTPVVEERTGGDKIVSPVVPQGSPAKFYKRFHSRSFSKEADEKLPVNKQLVKRRRSKSKRQQISEAVKCQPNAEKFCYGNVINYPNWSYSSEMEDQRLRFFNKELFHGKDILDIGCNTGHIALYIAKYFETNKVIGIDIDKKLVDIAERNLNRHASECIGENLHFPSSLSVMYGPLAKLTFVSDLHRKQFPNNVTFIEANFVPSCDEQLEAQKPEFDIILCLRVTKWIHLNWGDKGLKLAFKRIYTQLHAGGHLILEAQPWFTYSSKKKISTAIYKNYCAIELKPENFCEYLLSKEVGFNRCEFIGQTVNTFKGKGYRQPMYLLTKGFKFDPMCDQNLQMDILSPFPYFSEDWRLSTEEESCSMWHENEMIPNYSSDNMEDHL